MTTALLVAILVAVIWDGLLTRRWLANSRRDLEEIQKQARRAMNSEDEQA